MRAEVTHLRDQLGENLSITENEDEEMDDESKDSLRKTVLRLKIKLKKQRKVQDVLKQQIALNFSGEATSFNPDLIVSMAKKIEHLKEDLEAANQNHAKELKATEDEGLQESKLPQSQTLEFRNQKTKSSEQVSDWSVTSAILVGSIMVCKFLLFFLTEPF